MRTRDPFGEVLEDLRHRIRQGEIAPGSPLIVMDLAAELRVSATPVREALAYLAGEGLVEGRLGSVRGYLATRPGPSDLIDLLHLHQQQVLAALTAADRGVAPAAPMRPGPELSEDALRVARTEHLFAGLVARGGGATLRRAHRLVAERLHLVRRREGRVLPGLEAELAALEQAGAGPAAPRLIRAYHRRRRLAAVRLAALLYG